MPKVITLIEVRDQKNSKDVRFTVTALEEGKFNLFAQVKDAPPEAEPSLDSDLDREDALAIANEIIRQINSVPPSSPENLGKSDEVQEK